MRYQLPALWDLRERTFFAWAVWTCPRTRIQYWFEKVTILEQYSTFQECWELRAVSPADPNT